MMYITLRMANGKKITGRPENMVFFGRGLGFKVEEGKLTVNLDLVLYARPATDEEIEHARIHGW